MTAAPNQIPSLSGGNTSDMRRCYACNSEHAPKRVKIDGFTEALCVADYARFQRGESLLPFGCEPTGIEAHPLSAEQVERDLAALKAGSVAAMAKAARDSAKDVAALEAAEAERVGKVRVKVPIAPKVAPAPVAAPIQALDVVAVESKPEPAGEPVKRPYVLRPQSQPRPFVVRPESEQRPGVCRRAGCTRKPRARDLCTSCHTTACQRGIVDLVGAPVKPSSERDLSRDQSDSIRARIEVMASEKPGIHADDIASALGVSRRQVVRAILHLRNSQRLAKSATTRNDPNHLCVYPPSSPKTTHICTVRKP